MREGGSEGGREGGGEGGSKGGREGGREEGREVDLREGPGGRGDVMAKFGDGSIQ